MNIQHKDLNNGRFGQMSLCQQLANIGSEISRALNWKKKGKADYSKKAAIRALELLDFSLDSIRPFSRIRELARLREAVVDYFFGSNQFSSTEDLWRKYFDHFNYALRKHY